MIVSGRNLYLSDSLSVWSVRMKIFLHPIWLRIIHILADRPGSDEYISTGPLCLIIEVTCFLLRTESGGMFRFSPRISFIGCWSLSRLIIRILPWIVTTLAAVIKFDVFTDGSAHLFASLWKWFTPDDLIITRIIIGSITAITNLYFLINSILKSCFLFLVPCFSFPRKLNYLQGHCERSEAIFLFFAFLPPLQSGSSLKLPTGQFLNGRSCKEG